MRTRIYYHKIKCNECKQVEVIVESEEKKSCKLPEGWIWLGKTSDNDYYYDVCPDCRKRLYENKT